MDKKTKITYKLALTPKEAHEIISRATEKYRWTFGWYLYHHQRDKDFVSWFDGNTFYIANKTQLLYYVSSYQLVLTGQLMPTEYGCSVTLEILADQSIARTLLLKGYLTPIIFVVVVALFLYQQVFGVINLEMLLMLLFITCLWGVTIWLRYRASTLTAEDEELLLKFVEELLRRWLNDENDLS